MMPYLFVEPKHRGFILVDLEIVDTHCHLSHDPNMAYDRAFSKLSGMREFFVPTVDIDDYKKNKLLFMNLNNIKIGLGLHPKNANEFEKIKSEYSEIGLSKDISFIGEIGLDKRYRESIPLDIQKKVFIEMLDLAFERHLWVSIHCVGYHSELLDILKRRKILGKPTFGIIHAFSASLEIANEYIKLGMLLGIGPSLLNPKFLKLGHIIREIPISNIVLETDFPYINQNVEYGIKNSLEDINYVAKYLSEINQISIQNLLGIINHNIDLLIKHK